MLTLGDARLALHLLISRGVPDGKAVSGWMQERGEAGRVIHLGGLVGARPVWVLLLFTNGSHMLAYIVCLMSGANWTRAIVDLYQAQEPDEVSALNHTWPRPRNTGDIRMSPCIVKYHGHTCWTYMAACYYTRPLHL